MYTTTQSKHTATATAMYFRSITTHHLPNIYLHADVYSDTACSDRSQQKSYSILFDYYTASAPFLFTSFFFVVFFVQFCFWGFTRVKPRLKLLHDYLKLTMLPTESYPTVEAIESAKWEEQWKSASWKNKKLYVVKVPLPSVTYLIL